MAVVTVSGLATVAGLPNYVGTLHLVGAQSAAFMTLLGNLTPEGGRIVNAVEYPAQIQELPSAANDAALEGADAPTLTEWGRTQVTNVVQIWHKSYGVSYSWQAAAQQVSASASPVANVPNPVTDELSWQRMNHIRHFKNSANYILLNSTYSNPSNAASEARRTRGLVSAITTNAVAAGNNPLSDTYINSLLKTMFDNGALQNIDQTFMLMNSFQKQKISAIYGLAPRDRNIGGVNIDTIETDFGRIGVVLERHMPQGTIVVADMSVMGLVFLLITDPDTGAIKGVFFTEPLAKTGSSYREQIYCEFGLDHGPEMNHGKLTGLATS